MNITLIYKCDNCRAKFKLERVDGESQESNPYCAYCGSPDAYVCDSECEVETLKKYRDEMLQKQKEYLELLDSGAESRRVALAAEMFRLAGDAYAMAKEDGLK